MYSYGDSSIASPICQEGQSERTFPILAFSSDFSSFSQFLPNFPLFFPIFPLFPDFWQFFHCQGGTLPPLPLYGYTTVCAWRVDSAIDSYILLNDVFCFLRGYCTPDHFFDCLCIFLKNCNTLVTSKIYFL